MKAVKDYFWMENLLKLDEQLINLFNNNQAECRLWKVTEWSQLFPHLGNIYALHPHLHTF